MTTEPFIHPLSERYPTGRNGGGEETINSWAFASLVVNAAIDDSGAGRSIFRSLVFLSNPLFDAQALLKRCCAGDKAAIRQAVTMCCDGLDKKIQAAFEDKNHE